METNELNSSLILLENIKKLLPVLHLTYILVQWPESQLYMDEEWFDDEAILALGIENEVGDAAYFIPIERIIWK